MDVIGWLIVVAMAGLLVWARHSVWMFLCTFVPSLLKKLPMALLTMWFVATTVFLLTKAAGDNMVMTEGRMDETVRQNIIRQWGLDQPLWKQYFVQMTKLAVLDTMPSRIQNGKTMRDILHDHLPASVALGGRAMLLAVLLGIPIGVLCALYHARWFDHVGKGVALLGVSVPSFILASLVLFVVSRKMGWVPAMQWKEARYLWGPAACLGAFPFAAVLRLTRASMLEALSEDYVRTARAKGVAEWKVIVRHTLRNSLGPVVTYLGPVAAGLLTGSLVVEQIFAIPGMGDMFVRSVQNRDMPLILGTTVFFSALLVFLNLVVDALYPVLNPRLRDG